MGRKWRKEALLVVKMEPAQKELLQTFANDLGLTTSAAVRMIIGQAINADSIFLSRVFVKRRNHNQLFKVTDFRD